MRDGNRHSAACGFAWILLALIMLPATARAGGTFGFGDIQIEIVSEPKGEARHGYAEYTFLVSNTSKQQSHRVTLSIPGGERYGGTSDLRSIQRTVTVEPRERITVALYQPVSPPVNGRGVRVVIDDRTQDEPMPLEIRNVRDDNDKYGHYRSSMSIKAIGISGTGPLLLLSPDVQSPLLVTFRNRNFRIKVETPPAGNPGKPGGTMPFEKPVKDGAPIKDGPPRVVFDEIGRLVGGEGWTTFPLTEVRGDAVMSNWSNHWLGYSRFDGIILTRQKFLELPETSRPALWQYVETGGSLTILGEGPAADGWKAEPAKDTPGFTLYRPGFGRCVVAPADYTTWKDNVFVAIGQSWEKTSNPLQSTLSVHEANDRFPVVKDIGIPVRGLFVLMFIFAIIIGPVNISLLGRWKRRIWLLWTVPVLSGITVLAVFGYMFISEGWSRHLRTEAITILDENTHRASTVGWTAFYSPVTPGDGLHFSYDTEVTRQGEFIEEDGYYGYRNRRSAGRPCFIDLTTEQHFSQGWVSARIPAYFQLRKSESRRERVSISKARDGRYSIVNGLGSDIKSFWFADDQGRIHRAAGVAAGQRASLDLASERLPAKGGATMRGVYANDWLGAGKQLRAHPEQYLKPLTYLADVEGSPFVEEALQKARDRNLQSLVLGIVKELDHEN